MDLNRSKSVKKRVRRGKRRYHSFTLSQQTRTSLEDSDGAAGRINQIPKHSAPFKAVSPDVFEAADGMDSEAARGKTNNNGSDAHSDELVRQWLRKQRDGERENPELAALKGDDSAAEWWCHVCGTIARDGPPGEHFCWSKAENGHKDGPKVVCHYCRKGTSRMPDLRVHFKKIVYCRLIRKELKKQYMVSSTMKQETITSESDQTKLKSSTGGKWRSSP